MRNADPRPLAAAVRQRPGACESRPLEIGILDVSVLKCGLSNVPESTSERAIDLIRGRGDGVAVGAATAGTRNRGEIMHDATTADLPPLGGPKVFRPHLNGGSWHWTYHDEQGRLLVRGPESADRWAAHRGLLDAIAEHCTRGETEEEEEDEPVAIEAAALHGGAGGVAPANAPGACPAAMEPSLANGEQRST